MKISQEVREYAASKGLSTMQEEIPERTIEFVK